MITPDELVSELAGLGIPMTVRRLTDWREKGLLPPLTRKGLGRGLGTLNGWSEPDVREQAIACHCVLSRYARTEAALLDLWLCGYPVSHEAARSGFAAEITLRIQRNRGLAAKSYDGFTATIARWVTAIGRKLPFWKTQSAEPFRDLTAELLSLIYEPTGEFDAWDFAELVDKAFPERLSAIQKSELEGLAPTIRSFLISIISIQGRQALIQRSGDTEFSLAQRSIRGVKETLTKYISLTIPALSEPQKIQMLTHFMRLIGKIFLVGHLNLQRVHLSAQLDKTIEMVNRTISNLSAEDICVNQNGIHIFSDKAEGDIRELKREIRALWSSTNWNQMGDLANNEA